MSHFSESFMTEVSIRKRFGVVADEQQRAMSGLEFVQGLVDGTLPPQQHGADARL